MLAADTLFYRDGIAATSLRDVAEAAGVTRRTLYYHFDSKEALAGAYLEARDRSSRALFESSSSILAVFDALERWFATREFRGCALTNAAGEGEATVVVAGPITERHKRAIRTWFARTAQAAGAREPRVLADRLMICFDGALIGARTRRSHLPARHARDTAALLVREHGLELHD